MPGTKKMMSFEWLNPFLISSKVSPMHGALSNSPRSYHLRTANSSLKSSVFLGGPSSLHSATEQGSEPLKVHFQREPSSKVDPGGRPHKAIKTN